VTLVRLSLTAQKGQAMSPAACRESVDRRLKAWLFGHRSVEGVTIGVVVVFARGSATQRLAEEEIAQAGVAQSGLDCLSIELRGEAGVGKRAHVDDDLDLLQLEQAAQSVEGVIRVSDGPDRQGTPMHRSTLTGPTDLSRLASGHLRSGLELRAYQLGSMAMAEGVSIVLADDHTVVRRALRVLLEEEPGFEVVAEAEDAEGAIRYLRGHKPDVLILDLNMPGRPSLEAIGEMREASPQTRIVVLTMQKEPAFARQALQQGVLGYVLKEAADDELVQAVRSAAAGETYLQPALGAKLAAEPESDAGDLSERETDVLRLIALGHTNAEIAEKLYISVRTVETHRAHIQQKLGVSSRAELVQSALSRGLVET
jgi:two-component system response regulator NreC